MGIKKEFRQTLKNLLRFIKYLILAAESTLVTKVEIIRYYFSNTFNGTNTQSIIFLNALFEGLAHVLMFSDPLSRMAVLLALITFLVSTITGVEMTRKEPYQLEKFALQGFMLFN